MFFVPGGGAVSQQRYYSSDAFPTTLTQALAPTGNPVVASITGLPTQYPFTCLIGWGTATQEAISVTSAPTGAGPWTLPCTRGIDGSTGGAGGVAHSTGAIVVHSVTAQDFTQWSAFIDSLTGTAASNFDTAGAAATAQSAAETFATSAVGTETSRAEAAEANLVPASDLPLSLLNGGTASTSASAARTSLGLGTAATQASSAFDAAGAATAAVAAETTRAEGAESTLTAGVSANSASVTAETSRAEAAETAISSMREFPVALYSGADPTGATDSSAAVSAAQAAAVAAGGGVVSFGTGTWKFGTVTIAGVTTTPAYATPPLVHFRFAGPGATVLTPNAANTPLFKVQSGHYSAGVRFEGGFSVKAHASGSTGPAIDLTSARQWVIQSPSYLDSSGGLSGSPGTYAQVIGFGLNTYACRIIDPICEGQTLGACFAGSQNNTLVVTNGNAIENPLFEGNTATYMIDAAGTLALSVTDGIIEGNIVTAVIRLGKQTIVSHCWFEGNGNGTTGNTFVMDAAGVDGYYPPGSPGSDIAYDPGGCLLEMNQYFDAPDTLTIPSGVTAGTMVLGSLGNLAITDNTHSLLLNFQETAGSTTWLNNGSGGTNGTTVTTGNSGSTSGNAFSAVTGTVTFSNAETYSPSALSYSLVTSATASGMNWALPGTIIAGQTLYLRTYVYFSGSAFNTYLMATGGLEYKCGCNGTDFYVQAYPGSAVTSIAPSANTWYRLEMQVIFGSGTAVLDVYDALGNLLASSAGTGGSASSASGNIYFGEYAGGTSTGTMYLASLGLTNGTWLGPAIPGVTSVTAADASVVIGGTQEVPTARTGTLDVIAAQHPPAAAWSNNSKQINHVANGSASDDVAVAGQISYGGIFGDGSDGSATLDGTATVSWASKSGSTYTMNRDAWLSSLAISSGITLVTSGTTYSCRVFCTGTVTNAGTISANGASASGVTQGAGLAAGSGTGGTPATGNGGAGTLVGAVVGIGTAGAGGAGSGGTAGAAGGTNTTSPGPLRAPQALASGVLVYFGSVKPLGGAPGGGAGGGDGTNKGGGGGAGGGLVGILAHAVVNTGTISATGGAGGTPPTGNCGGGGGGGGGLILVFTLAAWTAGTTVVTGGALGTAVGTGSNGNAGSSGSVLNVVIQ